MASRITLSGLSLLAILAICPLALAQQASTELRAARAAGTYLGSIVYLHELQATECAYVIKRRFPNVDDVIKSEILPSFNPSARREIADAMVTLKPELKQQAKTYINSLLSQVRQDKTLDMKSGCGYVAGAIATTHEHARDGWLAAQRDLK